MHSTFGLVWGLQTDALYLKFLNRGPIHIGESLHPYSAVDVSAGTQSREMRTHTLLSPGTQLSNTHTHISWRISAQGLSVSVDVLPGTVAVEGGRGGPPSEGGLETQIHSQQSSLSLARRELVLDINKLSCLGSESGAQQPKYTSFCSREQGLSKHQKCRTRGG